MKRKLLFVTDVDWWALGRTAQGLLAHGETPEYRWDCMTSHALPSHDIMNMRYAAIVVGSLPAYLQAFRRRLVPSRPKLVVTTASFRDASLEVLDDPAIGSTLMPPQGALDRINAFIINDPRQAPMVLSEGKPMILHTDHVDGDTFRPGMPRKAMGPMRVGWAGSDANWGNIKHLAEIQEAAAQVEGVELVLQRREVEGVKNMLEMAVWYRSLDLYISANDELTPTPVPVLEALASAVPTLTTKCGVVWPLVNAIAPTLILPDCSTERIKLGLESALRLYETNRLSHVGMTCASRIRPQITWQESGAAQQLTRSLGALCQK